MDHFSPMKEGAVPGEDGKGDAEQTPLTGIHYRSFMSKVLFYFPTNVSKNRGDITVAKEKLCVDRRTKKYAEERS